MIEPKIIKALNNSDLLVKSIELLDDHGTEHTSGGTVNSSTTVCCRRVTAVVENPRDRFLDIVGRNDNVFGIIGECLWVLSGDDGIEDWMTKMVPRADLFSDDGERWRGAYSRRVHSYNQLQSVVDRLKRDNSTRQAVLSIYDPSRDSDVGLANEIGSVHTADMICNTTLYFDVVDGKLDITVCNRANDVIWGMCNVNLPEFSLIQEVVAKMVGLEVGTYTLFTNNMHYYTQIPVVMKQISDIRKEYITPDNPNHSVRSVPASDTLPAMDLGTINNMAKLRKLMTTIINTAVWSNSEGVDPIDTVASINRILLSKGIKEGTVLHSYVIIAVSYYLGISILDLPSLIQSMDSNLVRKCIDSKFCPATRSN